jgi:hypothetical protein
LIEVSEKQPASGLALVASVADGEDFEAGFGKSLVAMNGPRSLMRIFTDFPFSRLVTLTRQGSGRVLCAPVRCQGMTFSPSEVLPRLKPKNLDSSYHEQVPLSSYPSADSTLIG